MRSVSRYAVAALALGGVGLFSLNAPATSQSNLIRDGHVGFVVSDFGMAGARSAITDASCPDGRTMGYRDIFERSPEGQRREGESDDAFTRRLDQGARDIAAPGGDNLCMNPRGEDPHFRTMDANNVTVIGGLDLDGQISRANGRPAPGTCAHTDFNGANGERGIDNQVLRVGGCNRANQTTGDGQSSRNIEMYTGSWGILITLSGVDDLRNDNEVQVGLYANGDPIQLSPDRTPIEFVTYAPLTDPRFRAVARGRIENGVLTTEPVDVRFYSVLNSMMLERPLRDARVRATISADGALEGYLAGYTPIIEMYDLSYGFRNGRTREGELAPLRLRQGSATGAASVLGRTCEGAYAALHRLADGHRDPQTGQCTSISTQYRFRAIPAFVLDAPAQRAGL